MSMGRVCVVGAGISGVSTAVCVQEAIPGAQVTLVADAFGSEVTSFGPPGVCQFWYHHCLGPAVPLQLQLKWGQETHEHFLSLLRSGEAGLAGVQEVSGYTISKTPLEEPNLKESIPNYKRLKKEELNHAFPGYNYGEFCTAMMCECKWYLPWLIEKLKTRGGKVKNQHLNSLEELATGEYDVVVNCTGLRAAELFSDPLLSPVKGQLVKVKAPWIKHYTILQDDEILPYGAYIIPGREHVILGGYFKESEWNAEVEDHITQQILHRCSQLDPSLKHCKPEIVWAGLRPYRHSLRIEKELIKFDNGDRHLKVVHNYGHGGSGISLHWGASKHAASLVKEHLSNLPRHNKLPAHL